MLHWFFTGNSMVPIMNDDQRFTENGPHTQVAAMRESTCRTIRGNGILDFR